MDIEAFVSRWAASGAAERSNYQLFLAELCDLLGVPKPEPAGPDNARNAYVFERAVTFRHGDGSTSTGFIDLYRHGCFVLEAKQGVEERLEPRALSSVEQERRRRQKHGTARRGTGAWDEAMLRARGQAEQYARAPPAEEGRPPFIVVVDVGHTIELYSEFTRSGAVYVPYPDPRSHRIALARLADSSVRDTLRRVWTDPLSLDPARQNARITRAIAAPLARLAQSLERTGHPPKVVAEFLMRCLFSMFAEDMGLLPKGSFTELLESVREAPQHFVPLVTDLWRTMSRGGFCPAIRSDVLSFDGALYAEVDALPLNRDQIELLLEAACCDWRQVEPAIFGTLLERALDPLERHKLGAHYTPRAYVERLVLPTVVEPLREEWAGVQAAAVTLARQGKEAQAVAELQAFQRRLCQVRVLDPACGSGNFLYVTLEHLKRLEGEVLDAIHALGHGQTLLETSGITVDPHQLLGLEVNPRAATIAEMVLWIGYLQWHFRTRGSVRPPEPVIRNFRNIECRDAVLAWDCVEYVKDGRGIPVSRWDGRTYKKHPVTGEDVPDENACVPLERYVNPCRSQWPDADFVVGNPPFVGAGGLRNALGDGYAETLRRTIPEVPESADLVMYWWHQAAQLTRSGSLKRFGLITTNSIRQTFNRRVLVRHLARAAASQAVAPVKVGTQNGTSGEKMETPLSLVFAIPDHPWVDSADGAAVRIAMTVGEAGEAAGRLLTVACESASGDDSVAVRLVERSGRINPDLTIGANVAGAVPLRANEGISSRGMTLHGAGFIVTPEQAQRLDLGIAPGLEHHVRPYRNGKDLTDRPRGVFVIDLFGLTAEEVRKRFPAVYQWLLERVKPERDHNNRATYRENWWIFGEPRKDLRPALTGLPRYIVTVETAKHRVFQFLDASILPDNKLIALGLDDAYDLGLLSSRVHVCWALAAGSRLGVGNDPVYVKTRCFETFPFPAATNAQQARIRNLAEQIDAHRKRRQALHPGLTLTGMYNVLEKLRTGESLSEKERVIHEQGLVSVLGQLHDELDAAVLDAYGWSDLAPVLVGRPGGTTPTEAKTPEQAAAEETLLAQLVALNAERAAEERRGLVRWLRPEFQSPGGLTGEQAGLPEQAELEPDQAPAARHPWPKTLAEQAQAVRALLSVGTPVSAEDFARAFHRAPRERVAELLEALVSLGQARRLDDGRYVGP